MFAKDATDNEMQKKIQSIREMNLCASEQQRQAPCMAMQEGRYRNGCPLVSARKK